LARPGRVWEREVLLRCDDAPVVFAHTVVRLGAIAADWPRFNGLGERSLGSTLFYDPLVRRGQLEFARLRAGHPLMQRARAALGGAPGDAIMYARRCVYQRRQGSLLVTEVFLPPVLELRPRHSPVTNTNTNTNTRASATTT
ncbi:MAG: chorismate lyase, partial [Massilia sp.]